ncbi:hypothetical protein J6A31_09175 [bacterium]|nr:hypothetical protein [bacterium]
MNTTVFDHLGNSFPSENKMCQHYGIKQACYIARLKRGLTQEQALTTPTKAKEPMFDHHGNQYETLAKMCEHYGITVKHYHERKSYGWSLEKILTAPLKTTPTTKDHLGNTFSSKKEMYKHYGINESIAADRKKKGMSLEKILTQPKKGQNINDRTDHLGNIYASKAAMCEHYGITVSRYNARLRRGLSKENALTNSEYYNKTIYTDHLGNKGSLAEICAIHDMSEQIVISRLAIGWSLQEALTRDYGWRNNVVDHNGNAYPNNIALAKAYGMNATTIAFRLKSDWSLRAALLIPRHFTIKENTTLFENYIVKNKIDSIYYECYIDNKNIIRTKFQIYDDLAENISLRQNNSK